MMTLSIALIAVAAIVALFLAWRIVAHGTMLLRAYKHAKAAVTQAKLCFADNNIPAEIKDIIVFMVDHIDNPALLRMAVKRLQEERPFDASEEKPDFFERLPKKARQSVAKFCYHFGMALSFQDMNAGKQFRSLMAEKQRAMNAKALHAARSQRDMVSDKEVIEAGQWIVTSRWEREHASDHCMAGA